MSQHTPREHRSRRILSRVGGPDMPDGGPLRHRVNQLTLWGSSAGARWGADNVGYPPSTSTPAASVPVDCHGSPARAGIEPRVFRIVPLHQPPPVRVVPTRRAGGGSVSVGACFSKGEN